MAKTRRDLTSDGVTVIYDVDFDLGYMRREYVYVYLDGDDYTTQLTYTWVNSTQIQLAAPLAVDTEFHIRRVVPRDELVNDYTDGAILYERNLDDSYTQSLMILEEMDDGYIAAMEDLQNQVDANTAQIANFTGGISGFNTFSVSSGRLVARGYANESGEQGVFTFPILLASPPTQLNIVGSIFTLWEATGGGASMADPTPVLNVADSSERWAIVNVPLIAGYNIPADSQLSIYATGGSTSFEFTDE